MNKKFAQQLITKTRDDYNKISAQFASTRKFNFWTDINEAIESLGEIPKKARILDIGSGAGRISELFPNDANYTGLDLSPKLVKIAKRIYPERNFIIGNATDLPFKDNEADITVSIATLHHIPSKELRDKAISEIYRVTKPGGKIVITVWYFWDKSNLKYFLKKGNERLGLKDFLMSWRTSEGVTVSKRYFHAWTKRELTQTLQRTGFKNIKIEMAYRKQKSNLIIVAQKP